MCAHECKRPAHEYDLVRSRLVDAHAVHKRARPMYIRRKKKRKVSRLGCTSYETNKRDARRKEKCHLSCAVLHESAPRKKLTHKLRNLHAVVTKPVVSQNPSVPHCGPPLSCARVSARPSHANTSKQLSPQGKHCTASRKDCPVKMAYALCCLHTVDT
jgi:hypothetical protein